MKTMMAVGGGILIGVGLAWAEGFRRAEVRAIKKYDEQLEIHKRVLKAIKDHPSNYVIEAPALAEDELVAVTGTIHIPEEVVDPAFSKDYIAMANRYAEDRTFVDDRLVAESLEFIEEEEFQEDDNRAKETIVIFMVSDDAPLFMMDGAPCEDWSERVGDDILVDFYRRCAPGEDRVLYIRNHQRNEDYEVIQETP